MIIEIKIPSPGESITEVEIAQWLVTNGDYVQKDQEIGEIESDKATLPLIAEKAGKVELIAEEGAAIRVGEVACKIDTDAEAPKNESKQEAREITEDKLQKESKEEEIKKDKIEEDTPPIKRAKKEYEEPEPVQRKEEITTQIANKNAKITPLAKKVMEENGLNIDDIIRGLKKITTNEVHAVINNITVGTSLGIPEERAESKERMSSLRRKISQRLVAVKNETAMLTTFNEVDMTAVMELRRKYQKSFMDKYGVKLGFMSFFTKAASVALKNFSKINSYIEGENIITPNYVDTGIAVQTDKGLMVPVVRDTQVKNLAEIEIEIAELAKKARAFRITPEEMSGGTFTITNGGVFGSMLSTPILNPPQSGILGMHNIVERPVALNGQVVIRPMMYIALSYDHRIVDGRDSVSFLVNIKELLEDPVKMLYNQNNPEKSLLGIW